ncbi:creatinine amidohydrolase [Devosia pacifica]|uniref:Creatinine amidohydrolase n=1 Tax=Devosia pacifica TaxID=1335967 RepID=A0A918RSZ0_9HYPH|nr:creatininase family protein [Devosia pacifica]GHA10070.1 creatinine amidohydrolase [Devosia pacifica]
MSSRYWIEQSTRQMAAFDKSTVCVLPTAAVEQHGPHLPLGVDALINRGIIAAMLNVLPDTVPALILPEQSVGASAEHLRSSGTLSHRHVRLIEHWTELLEGVHRAGFKRVVIYNSHGGNRDLFYPIAVDLRQRFDMLVAYSSRSDAGVPADILDLPNLGFDIHAGAIETSIMMALRPDLVATDQIQDFPSNAIGFESRFTKLGAGVGGSRAAGFGWLSGDLNEFGACGDATAASADIGQRLVDHAADTLAKVIEDVWGANELVS